MVVDWVQASPSNRHSRVRVNGQVSDSRSAGSGVPQGSVLKPTLFLLFVNDLPDVLEGRVLRFADDAKLIAPRSDFNTLQRNLRVAWGSSEDWALPLNADKCVHLPIGQNPAVPLLLHDDVPISTAESMRDLGVFVTTNFKPSLNARLAVTRARARLFQVRRGFVVMTREAFLPPYLSLIRPILEYAIQAVSPYLPKDIVLTERLQKLATWLVKGLRRFP